MSTQKSFSMTHRFLSNAPEETFTEDNPPSWLLHKWFKWWYEGYVLALPVGQSIMSDFREITRIR